MAITGSYVKHLLLQRVSWSQNADNWIIGFGMGYLTFVIVWLYAAWREYYCLWPGLSHLDYCKAVRQMA